MLLKNICNFYPDTILRQIRSIFLNKKLLLNKNKSNEKDIIS